MMFAGGEEVRRGLFLEGLLEDKGMGRRQKLTPLGI